jgi:hypothetical protein
LSVDAIADPAKLIPTTNADVTRAMAHNPSKFFICLAPNETSLMTVLFFMTDSSPPQEF